MTSPLDDFRRLATQPLPDHTAAIAATEARESTLIKPPGALGRLEGIARWLTAVSGKAPPVVTSPRVVIFAASHGIAAAGVSAYPPSVNTQMFAAFQNGTAAINQICTSIGIGLSAFDLALDVPSGNIAVEDGFEDEKSLAATLAFGLEAIAGGVDCLGLGEMGIGNTAVAAALFAALYGGGGEAWCGAGTGVEGDALRHKIAMVDQALARVGEEADPLIILKRLGGRDVAAMVGAILAARVEGVPVVVDGFVATAAAALVSAMAPGAIDHCLFAHKSAEAGHGPALEKLGAVQLLDLQMRLGEGTGSALAIAIIKAAAECHSGMATFAEAGVDGKA
ncbi:MAG: nicotinate-nucleotide--dimethylbenzimidazole phosphoribosyltransferase [Pseudomonadota bacterium]